MKLTKKVIYENAGRQKHLDVGAAHLIHIVSKTETATAFTYTFRLVEPPRPEAAGITSRSVLNE
jgi:hypothetical protein